MIATSYSQTLCPTPTQGSPQNVENITRKGLDENTVANIATTLRSALAFFSR
jgi:hypothetical protein